MKKWIVIAGAAAILSSVLAFSFISSASSLDTAPISNRLAEKGVIVKSMSMSGKVLQVGIQSEGTDQMTPEDIKAIRNIRNEIRSGSNKILGIKDLKVKFSGKQGKVIYDSTINDITAIPDFVKKPEVKLDDLNVKSFLSKGLSDQGLTVSKLEISKSPLEGNLVNMVIQQVDLAKVNDSIPEIEMIISKLNESSGTGITQYDLSIQDKTGQLIVFLTADLVYRDFYWWQSPILNGDTWTKSKPRDPSTAPLASERPAIPASSPE
ncbi:hypothetical protein ACH6EH_01650 [Paenibacillus sp. JSM ZJ436]|uniref:hypothetical protein n=1 Tax=Paenibacillus sp. JSM ZJ436 TaxID=3376190 RepID=UPI0037BB4F84